MGLSNGLKLSTVKWSGVVMSDLAHVDHELSPQDAR